MFQTSSTEVNIFLEGDSISFEQFNGFKEIHNT